MEKSYKQFVAWATKWKAKFKADEFLAARIKLTFFYSLITAIILGIASYFLYEVLIVNLYKSLEIDLINPIIAHRILDRAQDSLRARILTIDGVILLGVILLGFFLTQKTLKPIRINTQKQKQFIADASHELRTPVAVVISGLEVALRNKNLDIVTAKDVLQKSLVEMREFSTLSNNILDISKYDNNSKEKYENINLSSLLQLVVAKMQLIADKKNITIKNELKYTANIYGNNLEIERVFYNVLTNAITHTPDTGTIVISDNLLKNYYNIAIKDTGAGIPKNIISKVFDPFFRGDSSRNTDGAGLGLTMAKKIIENHRGTITIKSEPSEGTTVTISLPTAKQ